MKVLKGILSESKEYYLDVKKRIQKRLAKLPKGSIKKRNISGKRYYYIQIRKDKKIKHEYLGKEKLDYNKKENITKNKNSKTFSSLLNYYFTLYFLLLLYSYF